MYSIHILQAGGVVSQGGLMGVSKLLDENYTSLVYKTHMVYKQAVDTYKVAWSKAVLLIRCPFESLIAHRNFQTSGNYFILT